MIWFEHLKRVVNMKTLFILVYNLLIYPLLFLSFCLCPFNKKIRDGVIGRNNSLKVLRKFQDSRFKKKLWFHVASHGEFQQIETIINKIKESDSSIGIIVSFFSPSGFKNVDNRSIDCKIYLPFDTPFSVLRALKLASPEKIIFASNDLWPNFIFFAYHKRIKLILTSARLNHNSGLSSFVKNSYQRIFLSYFTKIFTITNKDQKSISNFIPQDKVFFAGNPRYDRILENLDSEIMKNDKRFQKKIFILASLWDDDNKFLFPYVFKYLDKNPEYKIVIVPHEISFENINYYKSILDENSISNTTIDSHSNILDLDERVIIVNKVGFLSKLYCQTYIAYVGGGFSKNGIHNIIEPAAAANPVFFGPNYKNSNQIDAEGLTDILAGFSIDSFDKLNEKVDWLLDEQNYSVTSLKGKSFVEEKSGSTNNVLKAIHE